MGVADKGLVPLSGRALISHVIDCIEPQVDELIISAHPDRSADGSADRSGYLDFGYPVIFDGVNDATEAHAGPLAGVAAGLTAAREALVLFAACDMPALPHDLVTRLHAPLEAAGADIAVAVAGERVHPVVMLARRVERVDQHLRAYMASGGRRADGWYAELAVVRVDFGPASTAFANINTLDDLATHEARLAGRTP
jgi:molybdopterin-guanine dinucleotide biosynthesis protein A